MNSHIRQTREGPCFEMRRLSFDFVSQLGSPNEDGSIANAWILTSPASLKVERLLLPCDSVAVFVTASIVIHALVWNRPLSWATPLLIVAVPLLALGQVWMVLALTARRPRRVRNGLIRRFDQLGLSGEKAIAFGGLTKREKTLSYGAFFAGWLAAITAFPSISNGSPATPNSGCPWPLVNHGIQTCVSHSAYLASGVGLQRFAVGILLAFFSAHAASNLSEIRLRIS
jgi:hypothetical protein